MNIFIRAIRAIRAKSAPPVHRVHILERDRAKIRLHEFRADAELVNLAIKVLRSPEGRLILDVLANEHPASCVLPYNALPETRAASQARCEGYTIALANLEAMTVHQPLTPDLEPTFEREEIEGITKGK